MNAGELKDKIQIMALSAIGNSYSWVASSSAWSKAEQQDKTNIFSSVGIGVKSVKFTIRKRELSLFNAIHWGEKHCFLTAITLTEDRMFYEVTAALIQPVECSVRQDGEPTLNELNRPVYGEPQIFTFPACLTEKYMGHTQGEPMATVETRLVLVTPKVIDLKTGELVTIKEAKYTVELPHTLDEFKNEYEISRRRDA